MATRYKVNVAFSGTAVLEITADTPELARIAVSELTLADLAREGLSDVHTLKIAAKEITPASSLSGQDDEAEGENAPRKARPSGWYRPA